MNGYAEFGNVAHHSVGRNATEFSFFDFNAACKGGVIESGGNHHSFINVLCGGYDLNGFFAADIDLADLELIGIGVFFNFDDFTDNNVGNIVGFFIIAFDFGAGHCHCVTELFRSDAGFNIVRKPSER